MPCNFLLIKCEPEVHLQFVVIYQFLNNNLIHYSYSNFSNFHLHNINNGWHDKKFSIIFFDFDYCCEKLKSNNYCAVDQMRAPAPMDADWPSERAYDFTAINTGADAIVFNKSR
uniref:Uncharacterized protein n=1 Tax=Rhizophagus irregularis (strain DAOM 181602 / DAOM 197198 / MUCL 43194) TaxID=747089 RepID=U9U225_RHIID